MFSNIKRELVRRLVGHPMMTSDELLLWTPEHVKNGEKLHYQAMNGFLTVDDRLRLKKSADRYKELKGETFLAVFNSVIDDMFGASALQNITDTGGSSRATYTITALANAMDTTAASGTSTYGLVVGSNNTAVTRTDTKLNTQIAHGATSTTLQHGVSSVAAVTNPSGTITRTQLQRSFTGNPSSTVNIQEDAIYVNATSSNWKFCLYRNINTFGAVANAQVVTLTTNVDTTS